MYATEQDLIDRFGETELIALSDRAGTGTVDSTVVARALADAGELIESYLAKRYALPLSAVPDRLTAVACDLARYGLYTQDAPEIVRDRQRQALAWLRDVADGRVVLEAEGAAPSTPAGDGAVAYEGTDPTFTRDALEGW